MFIVSADLSHPLQKVVLFQLFLEITQNNTKHLSHIESAFWRGMNPVMVRPYGVWQRRCWLYLQQSGKVVVAEGGGAKLAFKQTKQICITGQIFFFLFLHSFIRTTLIKLKSIWCKWVRCCQWHCYHLQSRRADDESSKRKVQEADKTMSKLIQEDAAEAQIQPKKLFTHTHTFTHIQGVKTVTSTVTATAHKKQF